MELLIIALVVLVPLFLYALGRSHGERQGFERARRLYELYQRPAGGATGNPHIDLLLAARARIALADGQGLPAGFGLRRSTSGSRESQAHAVSVLRTQVHNFELLLSRAASHDPLTTPLELTNALDATARQIEAWLRVLE